VVPPVRHVHRAVRGHRHAPGRVELSVASTQCAPRAQELACRAEALDAVVQGGRHVHHAVGSHCYAPGKGELPIAADPPVLPARGEQVTPSVVRNAYAAFYQSDTGYSPYRIESGQVRICLHGEDSQGLSVTVIGVATTSNV